VLDTHPRSGVYYRSTVSTGWDRQILPRGVHKEDPHQEHLFRNFTEHPPKTAEWSAADSDEFLGVMLTTLDQESWAGKHRPVTSIFKCAEE
jgi:hypothetical protein